MWRGLREQGSGAAGEDQGMDHGFPGSSNSLDSSLPAWDGTSSWDFLLWGSLSHAALQETSPVRTPALLQQMHQAFACWFLNLLLLTV